MEQLAFFLKFLLTIYGILLLVLVLTQCSLVYYPNMPSRDLVTTPEAIGLAYKNIELTTEDGINLHSWYIPAEENAPVILFFHGNAGNVSHRLDSIRLFNQLGYAVFIFDYRGFGKSSGKPSEKGTYLDAQAALQYLTQQRQLPLEKIVYFGRSLGAAVASYLAVTHPPKALVLESTFTSAPDMAAKLFPIFPMRWLTRFSYSNIKHIKNIHCPVLIVHSPDDEIIPYDMGKKLFEAANEPKVFLQIHGGHNEGFITSRQIYNQGLNNFLTKYSSSN